MKTLKEHELAEHTGSGVPAPVYLLTGEDGYLIERSLKRLLDAYLPDAARDFNFEVFYGLDADAADVAVQASTLPMMADRRVVLVKEYDRLKDPHGALKAYTEAPSQTTVLILVASGTDKKKASTLARGLGKSAVHAHFYPPFESDIPRHIFAIAREAGYKVEPPAAEYLKDMLGGNLALIEAELNKVFNFAGERKVVTLDDVRDSVGDFGEAALYGFVDEAVGGVPGRAMELLIKLLRDGAAPVFILGATAQRWRQLVAAREKLDGGETVAKLTAGLPRFLREREAKTFSMASRLGMDELARGFHVLSKADRELKGSTLSPRTVLERLVLELAGVGSF